MQIQPIVNTLHLVTLTDRAGNLRTIEADGHSEDHISDNACIIRTFGEEVVYRTDKVTIVKTVPAVSESDKELWIGSPVGVHEVWNPPPAAQWFQSAAIVIVSLDADGAELERTPPRFIPAVP